MTVLPYLGALALVATGALAQQTTVPAPSPATAPPVIEQPVAPAPAADEQPELDPNELTNPLADFAGGATVRKKPTGPVDPDLPQPFDAAVVTTAVKASPFSRTVNLSDSLVLTGIANIDGKAIATLMDKESKKTYVVSDEPNSQGWRLAEIKPTASIKFSQVKVNIGGEIVTIRHDDDAQNEMMKKGKMTPGGGPSGPPSGGERGFSREHSGPSRESMERFNRMSPDAQNRMKTVFKENGERLMNMSPEDRRNFIESNFNRIASEDEKSKK